jgi:HEAT repeat protein
MSRRLPEATGTSTIEQAVETLQQHGVAPATIQAFSDLSRDDARQLRRRWPELNGSVRLEAVAQMGARAREDVRTNFERALMVALTDDDVEVRLAAINGLWECDSTALLESLLAHTKDEPADIVRVAEVDALGRFARDAGEECFETAQAGETAQLLMHLATTDRSEAVRLAALTSAAYLRPDGLAELIADAFDNGHDDARVAAVRAMGRYGGQRWAGRVIDALRVGDSELRTEAASAAAFVEDQRVLPYLYESAEDDELELQLSAIAALGEIGGQEARRFLRDLRDSSESDITDAAEDALANASLSEGVAPI